MFVMLTPVVMYLPDRFFSFIRPVVRPLEVVNETTRGGLDVSLTKEIKSG
jgi:hypothetical protein